MPLPFFLARSRRSSSSISASVSCVSCVSIMLQSSSSASISSGLSLFGLVFIVFDLSLAELFQCQHKFSGCMDATCLLDFIVCTVSAHAAANSRPILSALAGRHSLWVGAETAPECVNPARELIFVVIVHIVFDFDRDCEMLRLPNW